MNLAETTRILAVVRACWPQMTLVAGTADAWHMILGDLPATEVEGAVLRMARLGRLIPAPGEVRREVADIWGLLPPSEVDAWEEATQVASAQGSGRSLMHPAVEESYRAMGGAGGSLVKADSTVRAQFRDTYRQKAAEHERRLLVDRLPLELEAAMTVRPITAEWLALDEPDEVPDPAGVARLERMTENLFPSPDGGR